MDTRQDSPIHDHANAQCLMKVLKRRLLETRYEFSQQAGAPMEVIKETPFEVDQVTYMADELGLHKIWNPDGEVVAVSLHCKFMVLFIGIYVVVTGW
jgi:cysteine dioxygenase